MNAAPLILASSSAIRRQLLTQAGIAHRSLSPDVDERAIKAQHRGPKEAAAALARAKAERVSLEHPDAWVVGGDSIVTVGTRSYDKPRDREEAAAHLRAFSGKSMILTSAVALAKAGKAQWHHVDQAQLEVRSLSDEFIDSYLDVEWPAVSYCVGVFRLEGLGVTLFDAIEGDYFTVLGMPLLPLLRELRARGLAAN